MTKKQLNEFAKIQSAMLLLRFDIGMFDDIDITEDKAQQLMESVHKLAFKLVKHSDLNFGTTKQIVEYVKNNN